MIISKSETLASYRLVARSTGVNTSRFARIAVRIAGAAELRFQAGEEVADRVRAVSGSVSTTNRFARIAADRFARGRADRFAGGGANGFARGRADRLARVAIGRFARTASAGHFRLQVVEEIRNSTVVTDRSIASRFARGRANRFAGGGANRFARGRANGFARSRADGFARFACAEPVEKAGFRSAGGSCDGRDDQSRKDDTSIHLISPC